MLRDGLCFDDILLIPKYSEVESRSTVDVSVSLNDLKFSHPIIPANMKTITGMEMAIEVCRSGGLAILHRFMPISEQLEIAEDMIEEYGAQNKFAVSVGVKENDKEYITQFIDKGIKIICIDIAHGDSAHCVKMTNWIKSKYPKTIVIAGNVATASGAQRLWEAGANIIKAGIGSGALCSTRIETGNGVPQLTVLMDIAEIRYKLSYKDCFIISDGGLKNSGDIVKSLIFADMVMAGNLFAGCVETPGEMMQIDGRPFKNYVGSSTHKTNHVEGVAAIVPAKGKFKNILAKLLEGLSSGCSYQGANNLKELKENPEFIRITNAGLKESHPHDVVVVR